MQIFLSQIFLLIFCCVTLNLKFLFAKWNDVGVAMIFKNCYLIFQHHIFKKINSPYFRIIILQVGKKFYLFSRFWDFPLVFFHKRKFIATLSFFFKKKPIFFRTNLDLQKNWKDYAEFPWTPYPVSPTSIILH